MTPAVQTDREPPDRRSHAGPRKAVLICPECDHQSAPGGDWDCRAVGDREIRRCPDCRAVVERRPTFDGDRGTPRPSGSAGLARAVRAAFVPLATAWRRCLAASVRLAPARLVASDEC